MYADQLEEDPVINITCHNIRQYQKNYKIITNASDTIVFASGQGWSSASWGAGVVVLGFLPDILGQKSGSEGS